MASLFNKKSEPAAPVGPYARERIDKEIEHLRKRGSVRHTDGKGRGYRGAWPALLFFGALCWLFFMDPVLHALKKSEAARDYLYLRHFGSDRKAAELAASGLFTPSEVEVLNLRQGAFQNYYASPVEAGRVADGIAKYLKQVAYLHQGAYDRLDSVGKIRYQLFVRWGASPPQTWAVLDPSVHE